MGRKRKRRIASAKIESEDCLFESVYNSQNKCKASDRLLQYIVRG
jgi:hypothetical protein